MIDDRLDRFITALIARDRRERWRTLLGSPKGRQRLVATFAHGYDFDPRWATNLWSTATVESVLTLLRQKGAGESCLALSENSELDGLVLPLQEAVEAVLRKSFGTYLICDPDRLAYFESESVGKHFILERPEAKRGA